MNDKRDTYVHARVTRNEMQVIDALAHLMRRTRSDTLRILALEKAEEIGLLQKLGDPLRLQTSQPPDD
jgi:uncharacterized protein (DUF1778 family)